jgi:hypothetical protein
MRKTQLKLKKKKSPRPNVKKKKMVLPKDISNFWNIIGTTMNQDDPSS